MECLEISYYRNGAKVRSRRVTVCWAQIGVGLLTYENARYNGIVLGGRAGDGNGGPGNSREVNPYEWHQHKGG